MSDDVIDKHSSLGQVASAMMFGAAATGAAAQSSSAEQEARARANVILAWDGNGDFGPHTPGTTTAGWQEALDFCVANERDLYVTGGFGGHAVYHITDTIVFPPAQDFRVDGGVYVINDAGLDADEDAVRIDSCMNCSFELGLIVYAHEGAGMRIKPENPVPIDNFPTMVETKIFSHGIAGPYPFQAGTRRGTGLVFDSSKAPIIYSEFNFMAILNFALQIDIQADGPGFYSNEFTCNHLHTNAFDSTLLRANAGVNGNFFNLGLGVDQGATGVTGVLMGGMNNIIDVTSRGGGFKEKSDFVLTETAINNQINFRQPEWWKIMTDNAKVPSNQVTWTGEPLAISTVKGTPGTHTHQQRLVPTFVQFTEGEISRATVTRLSGGSISFEKPRGQMIHLSVGDTLVVESRDAPTLTFMPEKTR